MMDTPQVHDLLEMQLSPQSLDDLPVWARFALQDCPFGVVVRRQTENSQTIRVGIRGKKRSERHAFSTARQAVVRCVKPTELSRAKVWRKTAHLSPRLADAMEEIDGYLARYDIAWGPVGSAGFELATGHASTHAGSDLDFVLYCPSPLPRSLAAEFQQIFSNLPVAADCLLETPCGGVALVEYCQKDVVLLRTSQGPGLAKNPWSPVWVLAPEAPQTEA